MGAVGSPRSAQPRFPRCAGSPAAPSPISLPSAAPVSTIPDTRRPIPPMVPADPLRGRRGRAGGWGLGLPHRQPGLGERSPQGARAGGTRPYLSFPPGPHLGRRTRPVATAARFPWSRRVASLPRRGWLRLSGINPRQTKSHGLRGSDTIWTQARVQVNCGRSGRRWPPGSAPDTLARGERTVRGNRGRLLCAALGLPRRLARAGRDLGRLGGRRSD